MTELVVLDVGGTHARFARASVSKGAISLGELITLKTSDFASLQTAWEEFGRRTDGTIPRAASIAIAAPIVGDTVRMTNNNWMFRTDEIDEQLGLETVTLINDFAAVAHAVANARETDLIHICGPDKPLPRNGIVSVVGPGTGLGVAYFHRFSGGYHVHATEGGHVDFAPLDPIDDWMLAKLRRQHRRVSTERIHSGSGICEIYAALADIEKRPMEAINDKVIWQRGIAREDSLAAAAVDRFCASLGTVCGDYALAHGASALVLAGGIGIRLRDLLPKSGFAERFRFKGRYADMMAGIPVKMITHPQPGLYGAAAAFASEHYT